MQRLDLSHLVTAPSMEMPHFRQEGSLGRGKRPTTLNSMEAERNIMEGESREGAPGPTGWTWPARETNTQGSMFEEPQPYIPALHKMPQWTEAGSSVGQSAFARMLTWEHNILHGGGRWNTIQGRHQPITSSPVVE